LAVLKLVLFFDSSGDEDESFVIDVSHITRTERAVFSEHLGILFFTVVITLHHIVTADDDFTTLGIVCCRLVDAYGDNLDHFADAADFAVSRVVDAHNRARLGQTISFVHFDPEGIDELRHLGIERSTSADDEAESPAKLEAHFAEDEPVSQAESEPFEKTE